jgi:hypothetical protein
MGTAARIRVPKSNNEQAFRKEVRMAVQKINSKLGYDSDVTFGSVHATREVTAYEGRDILRYALMMGLVHK